MQCVMGLIEWFWIGNPKPVALLEDGTLDKARLVQEPLPSKKLRKFLIYVEFQQHQALIAKMLTLKEKDYVTYNGSMATTKRQRAVEKFANDPSCQIMIISNVGSAGLNITVGVQHSWQSAKVFDASTMPLPPCQLLETRKSISIILN
ncbi:Helicase conserved C-terminal domain [Rhizoctonia solani]|uniref:Helicase conserved C-terminal domain n=1 Tax=Rhizoctonia solani TaxID=456999 RepID=A0A8H8NSD8_9AGAM|nr:Helicase conserved C-terminal domain [Rhizoctonia solani]QRW17483.1 Helicase conserved C-terminal domain [Rhizoctonia solani]